MGRWICSLPVDNQVIIIYRDSRMLACVQHHTNLRSFWKALLCTLDTLLYCAYSTRFFLANCPQIALFAPSRRTLRVINRTRVSAALVFDMILMKVHTLLELGSKLLSGACWFNCIFDRAFQAIYSNWIFQLTIWNWELINPKTTLILVLFRFGIWGFLMDRSGIRWFLFGSGGFPIWNSYKGTDPKHLKIGRLELGF